MSVGAHDREPRDEFLQVLCHELRGALAPVLAWARMLQRADTTADDARQAGEVIQRNALVLARLASDLGAFEAGDLACLEATYVDLAEVARAAVQATAHEAAARAVDVVVRLGHEPVVVVGDAARLFQVLSNLLDNALKFTDPGGTVEVTLTVEAGRASLAIADTGRGIDPEFLPHVFEKFARGYGAGGIGCGLGLYVVRRLVELHGGSVEVDSAGAGHGSRFVVRLPAKMIVAA